jgi:hypothetical protein
MIDGLKKEKYKSEQLLNTVNRTVLNLALKCGDATCE